MPKLVLHEGQIASNEAFYKELNQNGSNYYDWLITILFYTILHYADAYCAKVNKGIIKFENHRSRETRLNSLIEEKYYYMYLQLKNRSRMARYDVAMIGDDANAQWSNIYKDLYLPLRTYFYNLIRTN